MSDSQRTGCAWALLPAAWALAGLAFARWLPAAFALLPGCPFLSLTGLPCPTCGVTRAVSALAAGDLTAALHHHPLAVLAVGASLIGGAWSAVHRLGGLAFPAPALGLREQVFAARALAVAGLANWAYLLAAPFAT